MKESGETRSWADGKVCYILASLNNYIVFSAYSVTYMVADAALIFTELSQRILKSTSERE